MSEDFASIVIIKRSGVDGPRFPLRRNECLFGRNAACDLRVQLPGVALEHAKVCRSENREFYLENLTNFETMINGKLVEEPVELSNLDVFSIAGRSFRFEYEQPKRKSLGQKTLNVSKNNSGRLVSPLHDANHRVVQDSPRNPLPRRASLRESLGKLRRSSVAFQEVEEPVSNAPEETGSEQQVSVTKSCANTPVSTKKLRKRVSFGPQLSPEQFDKTLPVFTPVKKGATPRRLSAPLSKPCLSPARRRYSVATSSFVSKIEEEVEESDETSDEEDNPAKPDSPAVEIVEVSHAEPPKLATPLRTEIIEGKKLRTRNKKMATPMRNAIKQGFRLKATKKKLNTPLRNEIQAGRKLKPTRKRLNTPVRKAIKSRPKLRSTTMKMPTPVRKAIEAKPSLRQTKKAMKKDVQNEIKKGKSLRQTKKVMPVLLQEEIKTGRKFLRIKRRMKNELQDEIKSGIELSKTKQSLKTPLRKEIESGVNLRKTKQIMPMMLQDEIKSGIELSKTKQSLKTPLRKEIESGVNLRKTKQIMPMMLQDEIKSGIELSKTKQSLKTPLRKEIESGVNLRKTKQRMRTMLQDEIQAGIELSKTKQSLKTPLRKEIESGVNLRKTKQRMPTMLQDEIQAGIELSKTKQSLKTPLRKEIESGVNLRKTKRRMPTMLQNEIESGIELSKTKQSMKTPLRKEIESGVQLKSAKDKEQPLVASRTPKRRLSNVDDSSSQSARKKLKTPSKTPQQAGFFPSSRSKTRSISRRKSTRKPSYADILKRSKLVAKRRLSSKQKNVFQFEAGQKISTLGATTSKASATTTRVTKVKNKTPSRRKSQPKSNKVFDGKKADDWNVVVNKRKIKRIKRQRAVKPNQELDLDGLPVLFKTPKATRTRTRTKIEQDETVRKIPVKKRQLSSSPGDSVLFGVAKLMKTPKAKENSEPNYKGVAELFEALEMSSPITITGTPSLRRASDRISIVTPLTINKTPSLRMKENVNDIVFPLQLSSTPSLRRGVENLTVALAEKPHRTPSLRRVSESLTVTSGEEPKQTPSLRRVSEISTVASGEEPKQTPSLRRAATNLTVVAAEEPTHTPSLKNAAENFPLASPLRASLSPSFKTIVLTSPEVQHENSLRSAETGKLSSTSLKHSETLALVSPFPVQPLSPPKHTSPLVQPTHTQLQRIPATVQSSPPTQPAIPVDALSSNPSPLTNEEPSTSIATATKRSKRKAEQETIPPAKRPRRTTSRNTTATVVPENVESETGKLSSGRASTRSSKTAGEKAVTVKRQVQKKTRGRPAKQQPEKVDSNSRTTTRTSRRKPSNDKVKSQGLSNPTPKAPTRLQTSKDVAGIAVTPQPFHFSKTKLDPIIEVPTPASSVRFSTTDKPLFVKVAEIENHRSSRSRRGITTVVEEPIVEMASDDVGKQDDMAKGRVTRAKRTVGKSVGKSIITEAELTTPEVGLKQGVAKSKRASRSKQTVVENKETDVADESSEPVIKTTRATRSRRQPAATKEINNVTKNPQVTKNILEEPTKVATEEKRSTRNSREASPVNKAAVDVKTTGRRTRGKATPSAEPKSEKVMGEKRVTRSKRGIAAVVVEENLPAPKRQKKTEETVADETDDKVYVNTFEQEKPKGRQTRSTAQKVVEEITISNTKTTRRKKPVVKEIVEETVVTYTRTTRRRQKALEENVTIEISVEGKESDRRPRKENSGEEDDLLSEGKPRVIKRRRDALQEKVEEEDKKTGGKRSKRVKPQAKETEQEDVPITRVTRSRRGGK